MLRVCLNRLTYASCLRAPSLLSAYLSIRQDTSGYVKIRQDTSRYVRIRQDTSGNVRIRQECVRLFTQCLFKHIRMHVLQEEVGFSACTRTLRPHALVP